MFDLIPLGSYLANSLIQNLLVGFVNNLSYQSLPQVVQISGNFMNSEIREGPDSYILQASIPGATRDSLSVKYIDNYLTVTANSDQYMKNQYGGYIRYIGNTSRSFYFDDIDGDKIDGNFENGMLKLVLPKKQPNKPK